MKTSICLLAAALLALCAGFASAQDAEKALTIAGLKFQWDKDWKAKDTPSMMSALNLMTVEDGQKEVLEAKFYFFQGGGGGVDANLKRWAGMFEGEPEKHEEKLADGKATLYTFRGTFMKGPRFGDKVATEGYAMMAAIVEGEAGPVFVRMDGPGKRLDALRDSFKKIITSPHAK